MAKERRDSLRRLSKIWTHVEPRKFQEGDRTDFRYWESLEEYVSAHPAQRNFVPFQVRHFYAEQKKEIGNLLVKYGFVLEIAGLVDMDGKEISFDINYKEKYPVYVVGEMPSFYRKCEEVNRETSKFIREAIEVQNISPSSDLVFRNAVFVK